MLSKHARTQQMEYNVDNFKIIYLDGKNKKIEFLIGGERLKCVGDSEGPVWKLSESLKVKMQLLQAFKY